MLLMDLPEEERVSAIQYYDDYFADFDKNKAEEMLKRLDIVENMRLKHMSKGTQEKVQLILTMSRNANLYCLDETTVKMPLCFFPHI